MANRKKIVKKITKPVIFALCCILMVGVLSIPTFALETPSTTYFTVDIPSNAGTTGGELTYDVDGVPRLKHFDNDETLTVDSNYKPYQFGSNANNTYGFSVQFYTYMGCAIAIVDPADPNTPVDLIRITSDEQKIYVDLSTYNFVPKISCLRTQNTDDTDPALPMVYIQIDEEYTPTEDYEQGYEAGYQKGYTDGSFDGFDDGYGAGYHDGHEQGYTEGYLKGINDGGGEQGEDFIALLFNPIHVLHNVVLYDVNGNDDGGEITIGGIFATIVGIWLFVAFIRYFAGG